MSIGEVLAHLRGEFPDITISKLRFLEAEGLVEPQRTAAGYRKYTTADVSRLRFVLAAQRDHYLPLRVIREQLTALDQGGPAGEVARSAFAGGGPAAEPGALVGLAQRRPALLPIDPGVPEPAELRLDRPGLLDRSGLAEPLLAELEQHGLIRARAGRYDADALAVARVAAQLAEYGLEPRHLRAYRTAADREVGLFTQLVAPVARQNTPAARARAAETVWELAGLSQQLHAALVRIGLRETLGQ
ncbi:MAG: MerR family transcriptional regulator [Actinobacteria bacterium 13_2_20CM_2_71_6]|nr:MAG: MerR family transcriptional regulator [Actinobacteria bacterium 13_2_20CM_2_71_6]